MLKLFFYHVKRIFEFGTSVFFNRTLIGFREKISSFNTLFILYWYSKVKKSNEEVTINFFEFKVIGPNASTLLYLFQEIFLGNEYNFRSSNSKPKIIDCGSNIGVSILYFKRLFPESEITAIEPNPYNFKYLKLNVEKNNLKNVELLNFCLSDKIGNERFYFENFETNNLIGSIFKARGKEYLFEAPAITLSSLLKHVEYDLIKIDIEGAERIVFKDLSNNNLLNCSKLFIIEYHHHQDMDDIFVQMINDFKSIGYGYNIKSNFSRIKSFQDILITFYQA